MKHDHIKWCKRLYDALHPNAVWTVPRSGLIFRKLGKDLVLTQAMPHVLDMPMSAEKLHEYQETDFQVIQRHFKAAGITVRKLEEENG